MERLRVAIRVAARLVTIMAVAVFLYGAVAYHDAPITPRAGGFYGKQGAQHTELDYRWFRRWETSLLVLWPAMFVLLWLRQWSDPGWRKTQWW